MRQDLMELDKAQHGTYKHTIAQTQIRHVHIPYAPQ